MFANVSRDLRYRLRGVRWFLRLRGRSKRKRENRDG